MITKEWLILAKEDSKTAGIIIENLYNLLEHELPEGNIINEDIHITDIYKEMEKEARNKACDGAYCMTDKEVMDIAFKCLKIEKASKQKGIKEISFEDLL